MISYAWLLVIPVLIYFVGGLMSAHRIRAAKFASRKDLSFDEIYHEYFYKSNMSKQEVEELWIEAAKALKISPNKLRPSDSFDAELKYYIPLFPFIDLNDDFYFIAIRRLKEKNKLVDAKNINTLAEYITLVASDKDW